MYKIIYTGLAAPCCGWEDDRKPVEQAVMDNLCIYTGVPLDGLDKIRVEWRDSGEVVREYAGDDLAALIADRPAIYFARRDSAMRTAKMVRHHPALTDTAGDVIPIAIADHRRGMAARRGATA